MCDGMLWDAALGASRAVWLSKQAVSNNAMRPKHPVPPGCNMRLFLRWILTFYCLHPMSSKLESLANIRIVLCQTSHPGNIGSTARAMKTMGLTQLVLVRPKKFPHEIAEAMASGASDILAAARVCDSLEEALRMVQDKKYNVVTLDLRLLDAGKEESLRAIRSFK